jgi:hypothetical protein
MDEGTLLLVVSFGPALVMPLAVEKLFFSRLKKTFVVYFSAQVFMFITFLLVSFLKETSLASWMALASPLPTTVFFLALFDRINGTDELLFIFASLVVLVASLIILLVKGIKPRREISSMEKIARETLMKPAGPEPEITNASAA